MKKQTNRMLVMFIIAGFVLLGIGCSTDTSQNNQNISNQNTSNENASNEDVSSTEAAPPPCTSVDQTTLINAIPNSLKSQYNKNFTLSYDPTTHEMTLNGFVYGNGNVMHQLLKGFDKYRSEQCVKVILLKGKTDSDKFEWCSTDDCPTRVPPLDCKVLNIVNQSRMKYQLDENLYYTYNKGNDGILEFSGFAGDKPNSGQFTSLFAQLQGEMNRGCVSKIVFAASSGGADKKLLSQGFEWRLCQPPTCECYGECQPCSNCPNIDDNTNKNTNRNTNMNGNTSNSNIP